MITDNERAVIKGFVRMGATLKEIAEIFWYLSSKEIENLFNKYKITK